MRLLISFVFVSTLVLHAQSAAAATAGIGGTCSPTIKCADKNAECNAQKKCACKDKYNNDGGTCKLVDGQPCTTKDECYSGVCTKSKCEPAPKKDLKDGDICTSNAECKSQNCQLASDKKKRCAPAGGASAVAASLTLMVLTLVTSRFL